MYDRDNITFCFDLLCLLDLLSKAYPASNQLEAGENIRAFWNNSETFSGKFQLETFLALFDEEWTELFIDNEYGREMECIRDPKQVGQTIALFLVYLFVFCNFWQ